MLKPLGDNLWENGIVSGLHGNTLLVRYIEKAPFTMMDARINQGIKFSITRMKPTAVMSRVVDRKHQLCIMFAKSIYPVSEGNNETNPECGQSVK